MSFFFTQFIINQLSCTACLNERKSFYCAQYKLDNIYFSPIYTTSYRFMSLHVVSKLSEFFLAIFAQFMQ